MELPLPMSRALLLACVCGLVACTDRNDSTLTAPKSLSTPSSDAQRDARKQSANRALADAARTALSGGPLTLFDETAAAFSSAAPNLSADQLERHDDGDEEFDGERVPGHAGTNGGLGP